MKLFAPILPFDDKSKHLTERLVVYHLEETKLLALGANEYVASILH